VTPLEAVTPKQAYSVPYDACGQAVVELTEIHGRFDVKDETGALEAGVVWLAGQEIRG
jgi:hypothetical protein